MLEVLHARLLRAQQRMKATAYRHCRDLSFEVNDLVYIKFRHYRRVCLSRRLNEKLAPRFYGPFRVFQRVGKVAYKLELPISSNIHPVFHISQVRLAVSDLPPVLDLPSQLSEDLELLLEPGAVLGYRITGSSSPHDIEVLIQWRDLPAHDAT